MHATMIILNMQSNTSGFKNVSKFYGDLRHFKEKVIYNEFKLLTPPYKNCMHSTMVVFSMQKKPI